ncbi:UNVERIFIED_CONTAM: hypothetical protein HDU68_009699 [Siphonaria sp. JEL0065]|nr:hypothetical protein HDU68_009699 [Siphonaria sp. JEL0065]
MAVSLSYNSTSFVLTVSASGSSTFQELCFGSAANCVNVTSGATFVTYAADVPNCSSTSFVLPSALRTCEALHKFTTVYGIQQAHSGAAPWTTCTALSSVTAATSNITVDWTQVPGLDCSRRDIPSPSIQAISADNATLTFLWDGPAGVSLGAITLSVDNNAHNFTFLPKFDTTVTTTATNTLTSISTATYSSTLTALVTSTTTSTSVLPTPTTITTQTSTPTSTSTIATVTVTTTVTSSSVSTDTYYVTTYDTTVTSMVTATETKHVYSVRRRDFNTAQSLLYSLTSGSWQFASCASVDASIQFTIISATDSFTLTRTIRLVPSSVFGSPCFDSPAPVITSVSGAGNQTVSVSWDGEVGDSISRIILSSNNFSTNTSLENSYPMELKTRSLSTETITTTNTQTLTSTTTNTVAVTTTITSVPVVTAFSTPSATTLTSIITAGTSITKYITETDTTVVTQIVKSVTTSTSTITTPSIVFSTIATTTVTVTCNEANSNCEDDESKRRDSSKPAPLNLVFIIQTGPNILKFKSCDPIKVQALFTVIDGRGGSQNVLKSVTIDPSKIEGSGVVCTSYTATATPTSIYTVATTSTTTSAYSATESPAYVASTTFAPKYKPATDLYVSEAPVGMVASILAAVFGCLALV